MHELLMPLTDTTTWGSAAAENKNYSLTGLNMILEEYGLVTYAAITGVVPANPPTNLLPDKTISGTSFIY